MTSSAHLHLPSGMAKVLGNAILNSKNCLMIVSSYMVTNRLMLVPVVIIEAYVLISLEQMFGRIARWVAVRGPTLS